MLKANPKILDSLRQQQEENQPIYDKNTAEKASNSKTKVDKSNIESDKVELSLMVEILETEYRGISLYTVAILVLICMILWTGISVVRQVNDYHLAYTRLLNLKQDYRNLQVENQRMLIEQQTFSATPQVTNRAVSELNMFYPDLSNRMIIQSDSRAVVLSDDEQEAKKPLNVDDETQH